MIKEPSRRRVLLLSGGIGAVALAGCSGNDAGGPDGTTPPTDTPDPTDSTPSTDPPTPTMTSTTERGIDDAEIDPYYGYPVASPEDIPEELAADHEVMLTAAQPDPEAGLPPAFAFDPTGIHVDTGDTVQFTFTTPDHTVTAYHDAVGFSRRVPSDSPPFSSPIVNVGGAWLYRFDHDGVYDLYCGPHHILGMVMRVVVGDIDEAEYPEYVTSPDGLPPFPEELEHLFAQFSDSNQGMEWIFPSPKDILTTSVLDPGHVQDAGSVSFETVRSEVYDA